MFIVFFLFEGGEEEEEKTGRGEEEEGWPLLVSQEAAVKDAELVRVEGQAVPQRPRPPDVGRLPHRAVAGARHVAQDAVVPDLDVLATLLDPQLLGKTLEDVFYPEELGIYMLRTPMVLERLPGAPGS